MLAAANRRNTDNRLSRSVDYAVDPPPSLEGPSSIKLPRKHVRVQTKRQLFPDVCCFIYTVILLLRILIEMQADSFIPGKSDFLQPSDSEIQTWMSKAFDMVCKD